MTDLTSLTISEASERVHAREVSPLELTEAYLRRVERLNSTVNAYVTVTAKRALEDARRATDELVAGSDRGPLHGIPVGLKDLFATKGVRTTAGSKILADWVPDADCTVAVKLREAGAVLLGKLNTHEFAWGVTTNNPHYGPTRNPWDLSRIPGGSSGGSGAAIAAHLACGTLGSDTGGSIRIPAALCGCVGLKPTYGLVSKHGVVPMSRMFDHVGPIARTVRDAAMLLEAIQGYDAADPSSVRCPPVAYGPALDMDIRGLRVGLLGGMFAEGLDPEVKAAVGAAAALLVELGASVANVTPPFTREKAGEAFTAVVAESQHYHRAAFAARPGDFGPDLQRVLSTPLPDAAGIAACLQSGYEVKAALQGMLEEVDLLLAPTTVRPAPPIGAETLSIDGVEVNVGNVMAALTMPINLSHLPAMSVPCGFSASGLPIGMQLIGRPFDESTVLRAGHAYERATEWHLRTPEMPD